MTLAQLGDLLKTTGLPVRYRLFKTAPTPPYIIYLADTSNNFAADDRVYSKAMTYDIELYSKTKDLTSEAKIETALDGAGLFYGTYETYIESEELYQVVYTIQI